MAAPMEEQRRDTIAIPRSAFRFVTGLASVGIIALSGILYNNDNALVRLRADLDHLALVETGADVDRKQELRSLRIELAQLRAYFHAEKGHTHPGITRELDNFDRRILRLEGK